MGNFYCPGNNIYSNSKVFIDRMFNGLTFEIENDPRTKGKIDIMTYQPGPVATKLSRQAEGISIPSPIEAARGSLNDLGKKKISNSVLSHDLIGKFMKWGGDNIPKVLSFFLYKRAFDLNKQLRSEGKPVY